MIRRIGRIGRIGRPLVRLDIGEDRCAGELALDVGLEAVVMALVLGATTGLVSSPPAERSGA